MVAEPVVPPVILVVEADASLRERCVASLIHERAETVGVASVELALGVLVARRVGVVAVPLGARGEALDAVRRLRQLPRQPPACVLLIAFAGAPSEALSSARALVDAHLVEDRGDLTLAAESARVLFTQAESGLALPATIGSDSAPTHAAGAPEHDEAQLRQLVEDLPQLVWVADPQGRIAYANRPFYAYVGMDLDQARAQGWRGIFHPDEVDRIFTAWGASLVSGEPFEMELRMHRARDGAYRWFLARSTPQRAQNGRILHWIGTATDIHDHKQDQERLAMHGRVLESMSEGVILVDEQGAILYANAAEERMFGYPPGGLLGAHIASLLGAASPAEAQAWNAALARARGEGAWFGNLSNRRRDGSAFTTHARITRLTRGSRPLYVHVHEDITARLDAERALMQREQTLSTVTDALPVMVAYVDRDDRYRFVNRTYEEWLGVVPGSLLGTQCLALQPELRAGIEPHVRAALAGEQQEYEARAFLPQGPRDAHIQYVPHRDREGACSGFVVLLQDITERKRQDERVQFLAEATATLASSLDYLQTLQAVMRLAVPRVADWSLVDLVQEDGSLQRLTICHSDPQLAATALEVTRRHPPGPDDEVFQVLRSGKPLLVPRITEAMIQRRIAEPASRERVRALGLASGMILPLGSPPRCHGVIALVTALETGRTYGEADLAFGEELARRATIAIDNAILYRDNERARAHAEQALSELARTNSELEQFAYISSHDLKEPIRMVSQFAGLLQGRLAGRLSAEETRFLQRVVGGAARMHQLVEDLLEYTRVDRDAQRLESVDLAQVVRQALEILSPAIQESGATVEFSALPQVPATRSTMVQLFQNLIANAVKFRGRDAPRIAITATDEPEQAAWRISVRDNGIGIDKGQHTRIFGVFQRLHTREEYPGTGIGLSICKKIIERLGGRIWVESEPGQGATFNLRLPKAAAARPASQPPSPRSSAAEA